MSNAALRSDGPKIGVLADDLTGAMASAARLRRAGLRPSVVWDEARIPDGGDAVVVDMRTRDGSESPRERASEWAAWLREQECRRYELRIDSSLRGSPAEELGGLIEGAGIDDPVVVGIPAFPGAGRLTIGGRQRIERQGADGATPRGEVGPTLFASAEFEQIGIDLIERGADAISERLTESVDGGTRNFVFDSSSEQHLCDAAIAVEQLAERRGSVVTASPGAWLRFYPRSELNGFVLVVVGSATPQNRRQLLRLQEAYGDRVVTMPVAEVLDSSAGYSHADDLDRRVLVVETMTDRGAESPDGLAEKAALAAARILATAPREGRSCTGLVASGGQTAAHLVDRLGASSLTLASEVDPLCTEAIIVGGEYAGLAIAGKGGAVGEFNSLERLVRQIEGVRG